MFPRIRFGLRVGTVCVARLSDAESVGASHLVPSGQGFRSRRVAAVRMVGTKREPRMRAYTHQD